MNITPQWGYVGGPIGPCFCERLRNDLLNLGIGTILFHFISIGYVGRAYGPWLSANAYAMII